MSEHGGNIEYAVLAILACVIVYSLLTRVLSRTILTLPIIFTLIGLAAAGPVAQIASPQILSETSRFVAEITLILVLFADASHVRFSRLKQNFQLPLRMLVIGMPLSLAVGTLAVYLLSSQAGLALALLTASVLTPTDAAVGQAVVSSPNVPGKLSQTINVESGLNDGLALPFVLFGAMLASGTTGHEGISSLPVAIALQLLLGPTVGIAVGWSVARALNVAQERGWVVESAQGVVFLATAFATYLTSELVGGNGFIAAFVAGMVFGNTYKHNIHFIREFMEGSGQLLTMSAFLMFGALLLPTGLAHISFTSVAVGLSFLTFVRMGPIWFSLAGSGLRPREKAFLGWFGPRGLASILFTLIMIDEFEFPGETELLACVSMTVFFSIILHGVSATPLANRIGRG
ncbi:MAG: cation:proton antiporter [Pseudomonadota bacterium]